LGAKSVWVNRQVPAIAEYKFWYPIELWVRDIPNHKQFCYPFGQLLYFCSVAEIKYRNAFLYKDYFQDFFQKQRQKVKDKIIWTIKLVETLPIVPEEYFKYLEDTEGIYEIRVKFGNDIFRILSFFEKGKLIVLANGFQKKTQKTPKSEIEKAERIKTEYFNEKQPQNKLY